MKEFLKGNYKVDTEIKESVEEERSKLEAEFERKALSRLGGSICFVSKKSFVWTGEQDQDKNETKSGAGQEDRAGA